MKTPQAGTAIHHAHFSVPRTVCSSLSYFLAAQAFCILFLCLGKVSSYKSYLPKVEAGKQISQPPLQLR